MAGRHFKRRFNSLSLIGSGQCCRALASVWDHAPRTSAGGRGMLEKLWVEFFSDPSQWWDHRFEKRNARYPDFKHQKTHDSLWVNNKSNPPWVEAELAAMAPGAVQCNIHTWNARLARFVKARQFRSAMELFQCMQQEGLMLNPFTFVPVLNACANLGALEEGRRIHTQVIQSGCHSDVYVGGSLAQMYVKCGSIEDAERVFNSMPTRNLVAWNIMISGYVKCGRGEKALELFQQMQEEGMGPDTMTFVAVLNACASSGALEEGRGIHKLIIQAGCESNAFVGNSLVDMYTKCNSIEDAWRLFSKMPKRDVVAWTTMILGYVKCGQGWKALELSRQMQQEEVVQDPVFFVGVLNACASVMALEEGRRIHEQILESGCGYDIFVGNSLIDMYSKCESIEEAWWVFEKMPERDVASWTGMILGYVKCGQGRKALDLFQQMQLEGVDPDPITFVGALNACTSIAALEEGRCINKQIIQSGCLMDVFVGSSLIDMYAKCGSLEDARKVFNKMTTRDVTSWTAMLGGYAMHGLVKESLGLFKQMCEAGLDMDEVTFVPLLSVCSHAGLVDECLIYFESMSSVFGISPVLEHYVCLVDVFGRTGRLQEAEDVVKAMPCAPDVSVWLSLLGSCRVHHNVGMGGHAAKQVFQLDPVNSAGYLLLTNLYAAVGKWDCIAKLQRQRLESRGKKHALPSVERMGCVNLQ